MVADNDLALGQIVEAVSKSKFWQETCIFVVEDDPQNGFDHVDGHRTVALVISPYTKRQVRRLNRATTRPGMVKTIELILGLAADEPARPVGDADARLLPGQAGPDAVHAAVPNKIPLDEMNPKAADVKGEALHWAKKSLALDLDEADEADEDTFNRILWHSVRGEAPYPEHFAGSSKDDKVTR